MCTASWSWRVFAAVALTSTLAFPQTPQSESPQHPAGAQPRIGLVLEGGAALGLAHVGVITWLEEHHIPVTYIAGTSMGGLVGGLYATGSSPAEMKALVTNMNWDQIMRDDTPYRKLAYRRKEDAEDFPNYLEFGLKKGVAFPEGLNAGNSVGLVLDRIALPYSQVTDFNELPTPFACVATELVSGTQHVFRGGSLAMALRSTMSLPAVFSPVRDKEHIFVDGGLLDNLPVDVAKEMGADVIIAIHLEVQKTKADDPLGTFGVLGKSISVVIAANELRSMENADVLVSVPLAKYQSTDYKKNAEIIQAGYDAAAGKAAVLTRFAVDDATWQQYLATRSAKKRTAPVPTFLEVEGTSPRISKDIEKSLAHVVGKPIDADKLEDDLTNVMGMGRYARVGYRGVQRDGRDGLIINADEKSYAPPTIRPIIILDGSEYRHVQFTVGARITFFDLGAFGTEWRNDASIGTNTKFQSSYYLPFGKAHRWFIEPTAFAQNLQESFYHHQELYAEYRDREFGGNFDFGYTFGRSGQLRVGYLAAKQTFKATTATDPFGEPSGRVGASSLKYQLLGTDDAVMPHRGTLVQSAFNWYDANPGSTQGFPTGELRATRFQPINSYSSLVLAGNGGTNFSYAQGGVPPFFLGGIPDLLAYGSNEFPTDQYLLAKAGYLRNLFRLPPFVGDRAYLLVLAEGGTVDRRSLDNAHPVDAAGALVIKTMIGPIAIGGSYGAGGHHKFFYQIGRIF
jgi:NTE family protein